MWFMRLNIFFFILAASNLFSENQGLPKIAVIESLDVDLNLLDPRKLATRDKIALRSIYSSWKQRLESSKTFSSENFFVIKPNEIVEFDEKTRKFHKCHFENLGRIFDYAKFNEPRHPPVCVGRIECKQEFDEPFLIDTLQAQDMPIAFPTGNLDLYEYRIPLEYSNLREVIQKVANVWHSLQKDSHLYYSYLSVSFGEVSPWTAQRRPLIHCDGFQSKRIEPKEPGEYTFVVSNALPTVYYIESFDVSHLDPVVDDFFMAYSRETSTEPLDCQKPYDIMMMDPYCLHAAVVKNHEE